MTSSAASGAIQPNLRLGRPPRPPPRLSWRPAAGPAVGPAVLVIAVAVVAEAGDEPAPRPVLVLVLGVARLAVLAALAIRAALFVLVRRAEIGGVVAGLRGLAGVPLLGFGAGESLGPAPGRVFRVAGSALVLRPGRPGIVVPGLVVHRLVPGRRGRRYSSGRQASPSGSRCDLGGLWGMPRGSWNPREGCGGGPCGGGPCGGRGLDGHPSPFSLTRRHPGRVGQRGGPWRVRRPGRLAAGRRRPRRRRPDGGRGRPSRRGAARRAPRWW